MKKRFTALALVSFFILLASPGWAARSEYAEGEVLIIMKGSSVTRFSESKEAAGEVIRQRARSLPGNPADVEAEAFVSLSRGTGKSFARLRSRQETTDEMIARLKKDPDVLGVARNYVRYALADSAIPNDPLYAGSQAAMGDIGAPQLWAKGTGSDDVVVGVIDTGLLYDHPDLKNNVYTFDPSFWGDDAYPGVHGVWYSQSYVDSETREPISGIVIGYNGEPTNNNWESDPAHLGDVNGHGSHVAGIIGAAGNNGIGVAGLNWNVKLLPVNVFSYSSATNAFSSASDVDIISALEFLLEVKNDGINLRAVNMSIGGWSEWVDQASDPLGLAIKELSDADVLIAIAAGNEGQNIDSPTGGYVGRLPYPASYKFDNTITVGALAQSTGGYTARAYYSNYSSGGKYVDLFAPGSSITSTVRSNYLVANTNYEYFDASGYKAISGTSMAAPMVTGAAALLFSIYPEKSATEVKSMLLAGANAGIMRTGYSKYGALNMPGADRYTTLVAQETPDLPVYEMQGTVLAEAENTVLEVLASSQDLPASIAACVESTDAGLSLRYDTVTNVIQTLLEADHLFYTPSVLPIFRLTAANMSGRLYAVEFEVAGARLGASRADLRVAKATGAGAGRLFTWAGTTGAFADGRYTLIDANGNIVTGDALADTATYKLVLFLADNGLYDLDGASHVIVDPTILYVVQENKPNVDPDPDPNPNPNPDPNPNPNPDPNPNPGSGKVETGGGGGGGCAAANGTALLLCLLFAPFLRIVEKRKTK